MGHHLTQAFAKGLITSQILFYMVEVRMVYFDNTQHQLRERFSFILCNG